VKADRIAVCGTPSNPHSQNYYGDGEYGYGDAVGGKIVHLVPS